MKIRFGLVVASVAVAAFVALALWMLADGTDAADEVLPSNVQKTSVASVLPSATPYVRTPVRFRKKKTERCNCIEPNSPKLESDGSISPEFEDYSPEDRKIALALDRAFWNDDREGTLRAIRDAVKSKNVELRKTAAMCAVWYADDAVDVLTDFMFDEDEEISFIARRAWIDSIERIEDDEVRAEILAEATSMIEDADSAMEFLVTLGNTPLICQIEAIVRLVETGTPQAAAAAREQYEFVTGEEYLDSASAQHWLEENWDGEVE